MENLQSLAEKTGQALARRNWYLATAESCTGGWLAKVITDVPGSSHWFERGFVTYTNVSKQEMLGVAGATLQQHGAVSEPVVQAMATGALQRSHAQVAVSISGIAGPGGGSEAKPVGTVWMAWAWQEQRVQSQQFHFSGDREAVRQQAVAAAMQGVIHVVRSN